MASSPSLKNFPRIEEGIILLQRIFHAIPWGRIAFLSIILYVLAFIGHEVPLIGIVSFVVLCVGTFLFALRSLHHGICIAVAELIIGSQGHLFAIAIENIVLPLRLGLFLAIMLAYAISILRERHIGFFQWRLFRPFTALILILGMGVVIGLFSHNGFVNLFFDVNGYLYLGLIGPATQHEWTTKQKDQLLSVIIIATITLSIISLAFLTLFAQTPLIPSFARTLYVWIRDTRLGEVTRFDNGFVRVFLQSQIYAVFLFFLSAAGLFFSLQYQSLRQLLRHRAFLALVGCFVLSSTVIFISYSRSFWAGSATTALVVGGVIAWQKRHDGNVRRTFRSFLFLCMMTIVLDFGIVAALVNIPFPGHTQVLGLLSERTQNIGNEPAAASRYQALAPLVKKIQERPLLGSGFGTTVTYTSRDPRVLTEKSDGRITTTAVEWGYLDMMTEFGIVGLLVLGWLLFKLARIGWRYWPFPNADAVVRLGMLASLGSLIAIHAITPYLNHPLGVGWLVVVSIFFLPPFRRV